MVHNLNRITSPNEFLQGLAAKGDFHSLWLYRLISLGLRRFKWTGLPPEMDERYLNMTLFFQGFAGFCTLPGKEVKPPNVLALQVTPTLWDYNDNPARVTARGSRGIISPFDCEQGRFVFIRANDLCIPWIMYAHHYASQLADLDTVISANADQHKHPFIITGPRKIAMQLRDLYTKITRGDRVILGDDEFSPGNTIKSSVQALNTGIPYILDKLQNQKHEYLNEYLTTIGINNTNIEKKERVNTYEVNANNELIFASTIGDLECRKTACDQASNLLGFTPSVELVDLNQFITKEGGVNDAELLGG